MSSGADGWLAYSIQVVSADALQPNDPIFESLRGEYSDFDRWLARVRQERRTCLAIRNGSDSLQAVAILKTETDEPHGLTGSVMKICTMKVDSGFEGEARGSRLIEAVLDRAVEEGHDYVYGEVFEYHAPIIRLVSGHGFRDLGARTERGETVMVRTM